MPEEDRPRRTHRLERVRVELRLPPDTAELLYRWADDRHLTLSAAATALLSASLADDGRLPEIGN